MINQNASELIAVAPKEAFAMIGIGVTKGYELIGSGELECFKVGRATRVTVASIHAFVARQIAKGFDSAKAKTPYTSGGTLDSAGTI